jgi:hypothetical protein
MTDVTEAPGGPATDGVATTGGPGVTAADDAGPSIEQLIADESTGGAGGAGGGASPNAAPQTGGTDSGSSGGDAQRQQQQGAAEGREPGDGGGETPKVSEEFAQLPEWARKRIRGLEKEAGDNRLKAKNAEQAADSRVKDSADRLQSFVDGFAKVMGLTEEPDDRPKTIDEAMRRLEASNGQIQEWTDRHRQLEVQLAVWQAAGGLGANTPELMDSHSFLSKIDRLDPSADDFTGRLSELISAQIEANPTRFKAQPPRVAAPVQSGGEFTGGPGGRTPSDADMSIEDHIRTIDPVSAAVMRDRG